MPRERDPNRERAFELWRDSGGQMDLVVIAAQLGISAGTVRGWKSKDGWEAKLSGTLQSEERNAPKDTERSKRRGAPPGNQFAKGHGAPRGNSNAKGNKGGYGGPCGNDKAVTHGFFRRIFPDDEETHAIIDEIGEKSPVDILWENIIIQYTAIVRAQKIMFVRDQNDETKVLTKVMDSESVGMNEWEYQHAWDKHASFLQAQSRAMSTLQGMISKYEDMCNKGFADEEQQLRIQKLKSEIAKINKEAEEEDEGVDDAMESLAKAIKGEAEETKDES